jgi:hypothetical protein
VGLKTLTSLKISRSIFFIIRVLSLTWENKIYSHFWRPVISCSAVEIIFCRVNWFHSLLEIPNNNASLNLCYDPQASVTRSRWSSLEK